jgi:hypothetical protein
VLNGKLHIVGGWFPCFACSVAAHEVFDQALFLQVTIDIKAGSSQNSINPHSNGNIPVAVFTTESFDATSVDPSTVRFGRTGQEAAPLRAIVQDSDGVTVCDADNPSSKLLGHPRRRKPESGQAE